LFRLCTRWCRCRGGAEELSRCREVQVQILRCSCRAAELQSCRELQGECRGAEEQRVEVQILR